MHDTKVFETSLGIQTPWRLRGVALDTTGEREEFEGPEMAPRADPANHLERIQHEIGGQRRGDTPADDPTRKEVDHKGDVDDTAPRGDVGEIQDPELVRAHRGEVTIGEISVLRRSRTSVLCRCG